MSLVRNSRRAAATSGTWVLSVNGDDASRRPDRLVAEEPLELRLAGAGEAAKPLVLTMRTPGHDFELAAGYLFSEGIATSAADIAAIRYCRPPGEEQLFNVVSVELAGPAPEIHHRAMANSSCGLCGKSALEDLRISTEPVPLDVVVRASLLRSLPQRLRSGQKIFGETGGLHAAGVFGPDGKRYSVREDVGRHNAFDKVVGAALLRSGGSWTPSGGRPLEGAVVMVSGRVGFEIVQKAAAAGVSVLAAISAPSSLAVQAAEQVGMTVVGFLREDHFNIYSSPERVELNA